VVGSNVGGIPEVIMDAQTGLLVPPGDHVLLAEAISSLVSDPARANAMGQLGRQHVAAEFSWASIAAQTAALYTELTREAVASDPSAAAARPFDLPHVAATSCPLCPVPMTGTRTKSSARAGPGRAGPGRRPNTVFLANTVSRKSSTGLRYIALRRRCHDSQ
jgi:hypothetical protein